MMKKKRTLIFALCVVFMLASVQPVFAGDLFDTYYPKLISPDKEIQGTLNKEGDPDLYSFFGNGGTYKLQLFVKDPYIDPEGYFSTYLMVDYGKYDFYSANPGWQMPEYHFDGGTAAFCDTWEPVSDGWYTCTETIGKVKAGKKVGLSISGDGYDKYEYKFKIIGKKFADPKKPVVKSVKGKKHAMVVKWKKAKNAKGYLIQISHNKGWGKHYKEIKVKGDKVSKTIKKLKKGRYYVKICSYKTVKGVTAYSKWTKAKKVIVK